MKLAYMCVSCGAHHDPQLVNEWGRNNESDGLGPLPICPQLVEDARTGVGSLCRGTLSPIQVRDDRDLLTPTSR